VVIAGDTVPCEGLDLLCADADVLVLTVIRKSLVEPVPSQRFRDILDYHSGTEEAGRTASRGKVKTLVLNHCVPAPSPGTEEEWINETAIHFSDKIMVAHDLMRVVV
jgi:ribonuclease Z